MENDDGKICTGCGLKLPANAFKEGDEMCRECRDYFDRDVQPILGAVITGAHSSLRGLWEIELEKDGKKFTVSIDFGGDGDKDDAYMKVKEVI